MADKSSDNKPVILATPLVAYQREREKLLAQMTDATKEVALACEKKLAAANRGNIMTLYYIGARMVDALDEAKQGQFGSNAAKQITAYLKQKLGGDENLLHGLRRVATVFDEAFVKEHSEKPIGNGGELTMTHLIALTAIDSPEDREKTFAEVVSHGLSAEQIKLRLRSGELKARNTRSGGRKVSPPLSLLSGLEKLRAEATKVSNYLEMCDKHVFGKIAKMPVADITDTLVAKLQADKEELAGLREKLDEADKHIDTCLTRAEQALAQKQAAAPKAEAAKPAAKAAAKPAAKGGAKAAGKGGKKGAKPKPKVKAGRPAPATAGV